MTGCEVQEKRRERVNFASYMENTVAGSLISELSSRRRDLTRTAKRSLILSVVAVLLSAGSSFCQDFSEALGTKCDAKLDREETRRLEDQLPASYPIEMRLGERKLKIPRNYLQLPVSRVNCFRGLSQRELAFFLWIPDGRPPMASTRIGLPGRERYYPTEAGRDPNRSDVYLLAVRIEFHPSPMSFIDGIIADTASAPYYRRRFERDKMTVFQLNGGAAGYRSTVEKIFYSDTRQKFHMNCDIMEIEQWTNYCRTYIAVDNLPFTFFSIIPLSARSDAFVISSKIKELVSGWLE